MLKKLIQKTSLSSDKDKKILYICRASGKCKNLIALLQMRPDIDVDAAIYVSLDYTIIVKCAVWMKYLLIIMGTSILCTVL